MLRHLIVWTRECRHETLNLVVGVEIRLYHLFTPIWQCKHNKQNKITAHNQNTTFQCPLFYPYCTELDEDQKKVFFKIVGVHFHTYQYFKKNYQKIQMRDRKEKLLGHVFCFFGCYSIRQILGEEFSVLRKVLRHRVGECWCQENIAKKNLKSALKNKWIWKSFLSTWIITTRTSKL